MRSSVFTCMVSSFMILATVQGCAFVRGKVEKRFSQEEVASIQQGITTRSDVAELLGAPDEVVDAGGYEIFHYRRFDSKLGYVLFFSRANIASDNVWVFFNEQHIVEEVISGNRTDDLEFQVWPFGE